MTRINLIRPSELCRQHLIAEYRELPRIFSLACAASLKGIDSWKSRQPAQYTLGTGHMIFFYDKLGFLANRHSQLVNEMKARGYNVSYSSTLFNEWKDKIPAPWYWQDYSPTPEAIELNRARINERLAEMKDTSH